MKRLAAAITLMMLAAPALGANVWYTGDAVCRPPPDDGTYSAPYRAIDHPDDYPTFAGADTPGWSCSYQREDGVTVQYGDSRTPQEQWLAVWGNNNQLD